MNKVDLSVIVLDYNEADKIGEKILAMKNSFDEYVGKLWELIFVNDRSTDNRE